MYGLENCDTSWDSEWISVSEVFGRDDVLTSDSGFLLALESTNDGLLFACVLVVAIIIALLTWWSKRRDEQRRDQLLRLVRS